MPLRDADAATRVVSGRLVWDGRTCRGVEIAVRDPETPGDVDGIAGYPLEAGRCVSLDSVRKEPGFY